MMLPSTSHLVSPSKAMSFLLPCLACAGAISAVAPLRADPPPGAVEREPTSGLRVMTPAVRLVPAPLQPLQPRVADQSIILGRSVFMAPGEGRGDITPVYEPVEDGGFRITGGKRKFNRVIVQGRNIIHTGDLPVFQIWTDTGSGYTPSVGGATGDRVFPLWPRPNPQAGGFAVMGTLRLGAAGPAGKTVWLDELPGLITTTTFRPGYTEHRLAAANWQATVRVVPALDSHGMLCRIEFDREVPLTWQFGGIYCTGGKDFSNAVKIDGAKARITETNLPNNLVLAGWDAEGTGRAIVRPDEAWYGQCAEFAAKTPRRVYHVVAAWGVTSHDEALARAMMKRLDTPFTAGWPQLDRLKQAWYDCNVGRALDPEKRFQELMQSPGKAFDRAIGWWDARRAEFQVRTPDAHVNALVNWLRCVSEYHRRGVSLTLCATGWDGMGHISVGWYGKEWGGDHEAVGDCLRVYGALAREDGFLRWITPSLTPYPGEYLDPYWVEHVWRHYTWTGDRQFVRDLWPVVQKAIAQFRASQDPDGDGLCGAYTAEYWNCEFANGKGPKTATLSEMLWAALDRAVRMAAVVGDAKAEGEYKVLAEKTRTAIFRELWRDEPGLLGSIGEDAIWRSHPAIWEEFLAVNAGLLNVEQGRKAMRWIATHYGFEPKPGLKLLATSDWWPIVWSIQWCATGDTCLAALAGMKCGDGDLWWPYLKTSAGSAFRSGSPGIYFGISNHGAGGGMFEAIDADDPPHHAVIRGLFGIEPALHEGRLEICPAFPSDWREASIRTPDVSYEWRRDGDRATFRIRTPKPLVKVVRANITGPQVTTPAETESVITVTLGPVLPPPATPRKKTIVVEQQPASPPAPLTAAQRQRQVLFDLAGAGNVTTEELVAMKFVFDCRWNTSLAKQDRGMDMLMPPSPRVLETPAGWKFLTAGRPDQSADSKPPKNLLALASWKPYPLPGGATIPVGRRCERLALLLQSYVQPQKHYIVNGEVVLNYADGTRRIESLIAPFNLDCYFQHYSRGSEPVPFGKITGDVVEHMFGKTMPPGAHADVLEIACDAGKPLDSVKIRATCSEAVIGVAGLTAVTAEKQSPP